jgi:flagellar biosynthesis protein FliP
MKYLQNKLTILLLSTLAITLLPSAVFAADTPIAPSATSSAAAAQNANGVMPGVGDLLKVVDKATSPENMGGKDWSGPIKMVVVFSVLALLPSLLVMMTSFTRIIIVLSFIRRALTTQTIPPTVAIVGLALFLTLFTMAPTFSKINVDAIIPYTTDKINAEVAAERAADDLKQFMLRQTRQQDLAVFVQMSKIAPPATAMAIPLHVVTPAFIISEFRTSFEIGCLIFIPFLLIDLVVSSILLSAGMMMLPPQMISLPFKLILFILVDGWGLLAKSLSMGFN